MKKWDPVDIVVLIIVIVIGTILIFGEIKELLADDSAVILKDISHAIGGLITIVSTYVGFKLGKKAKNEE